MDHFILIDFVALFMGISLLLYCLLGGADFGAGMLEMFTLRKDHNKHRKVVNRALGPVWEANHVWLILALVISFNAFPKAFSQVCITFHIPLTVMLIGIVLRGCAFTFRHYDVYKDKSHTYYSLLFTTSSLLTPFSIGLVAGGLILGRIDPLTKDFFKAYVHPWLNLFSFSVAVFLCCFFAYIASVFLVGETSDKDLKEKFIRRAKFMNIVCAVTGLPVMITGWASGSPLFEAFLTNSFSLFCIAVVTLLTIPGWVLLNEKTRLLPRLIVSAQWSLVLLGWYNVQHPYIIPPSPRYGFEGWTLYTAAAPDVTFQVLFIALVAGSVLIFPALFYLFKVFKLRGSY